MIIYVIMGVTQALILSSIAYIGFKSWVSGARVVPFILSPGAILTASVFVGSLAAYTLNDVSLQQYAGMWFLQALGMILGLYFASMLTSKDQRPMRLIVDEKLVETLSAGLMGVSVLSALLFFAKQGVPILMNDIEQGRVDAAAGGTGYARLLAYMSVPAAVMMFAVAARGRWLFISLALLIVVALANRSPIVYLAVPLVFGYVIAINRRVKSMRIVAMSVAFASIIIGIGTYRIVSQAEFVKYSEYRSDLVEGNIVGVAATSFNHYARVVADNAVLAKYLVDSGRLEHKFGASYFTLFATALPGEQLSLDREIKLVSGKRFIGGGTPPTLMGEGYINFGLLGVLASAGAAAFLLQFWHSVVFRSFRYSSKLAFCFAATIYGFFCCWVIMSQVAGFAGASSFPMAMAVVIAIFWKLVTKRQYLGVSSGT